MAAAHILPRLLRVHLQLFLARTTATYMAATLSGSPPTLSREDDRSAHVAMTPLWSPPALSRENGRSAYAAATLSGSHPAATRLIVLVVSGQI